KPTKITCKTGEIRSSTILLISGNSGASSLPVADD
ncbi:MAG: hypothetical protein ACI9NQ_000307, partial [Paracoccaceae bacterium]